MRQRLFSFFLMHCSHWLMVACVIVNVQCFQLIEAFQRADQTRCGTRMTIPTSFSAGYSTSRFPRFVASETTKPTQGTRLFDKQQQDNNDDNDANVQEATTTEEQQVVVGTKDYYDGFLSSPIQDETVAERGSGLEQALKLGGGVTLLLIVLLAGFMASNGLI